MGIPRRWRYTYAMIMVLLFINTCYGSRSKGAESVCINAIFDEPIDPNDEILFEGMVKRSFKNEPLEARAIVRLIAEDYKVEAFMKSPHFSENVIRILHNAMMKVPEHERPYNIDVKNAYERYFRYRRTLRHHGMFWHQSAVCQAAQDAAFYFIEVEAFMLAELFTNYLKEFECDDAYRRSVAKFNALQ